MKNSILAIALAFVCLNNSFGDTLNDNSLENVEVIQFKFWDGFYFGANGGVQIIADGPHNEDISKNLSPSFNIFGGLDFNPYWGTRFQVGYTKQTAYVGETGSTFYGDVGQGFGEKFHTNIINIDITPTINLTNTILGSKNYNERKFNAYLYAGAGIMHAFAKGTNSDDSYLTAGLIGTYKVAPNWHITAEISERACSSAILGYYNAHPTYNFLSAKLGFIYKLNKKGFKTISTQPYVDKINTLQTTIHTRDNEISRLNGEIARLEKDIANKNAEIERLLKEQGITAIPELPIFFNINSAVVDQRSKYILEKYCECVKQMGSDYTLEVVGYCDLRTGTRAYNEQLKVKRAYSVADIMSKEYGIPADNIKADGGNLENSPYPNGKYIYSRVAIVRLIKK